MFWNANLADIFQESTHMSHSGMGACWRDFDHSEVIYT